MKKLLVAAALVAISTSAFAEDFNRIENNIRIESGAWGVGAKLNINDSTREVGVDYSKNGLTLGYIRGEGATDASDENRPFVAYSASQGPFYGRVQVELRDFVQSGADDYVRLVPTIGAQKGLGSGVTAYGDVTPKLAYGKEGVSDLTEILETEWKVGFNYEVAKNLQAGPFVQYVTDNDWKKSEVFLGTSIVAKF